LSAARCRGETTHQGWDRHRAMTTRAATKRLAPVPRARQVFQNQASSFLAFCSRLSFLSAFRIQPAWKSSKNLARVQPARQSLTASVRDHWTLSAGTDSEANSCCCIERSYDDGLTKRLTKNQTVA